MIRLDRSYAIMKHRRHPSIKARWSAGGALVSHTNPLQLRSLYGIVRLPPALLLAACENRLMT